MKKIIRFVILILCIGIISGCTKEANKSGSNNTNKGNNITESGEKAKMTKQQEAIFKSYGLTEEEIEEMKVNGMDYKYQSFVDAAQIMLTYLEEKYGESFEVVGGGIPVLLSHEYWITARACEGEYAGKKFDVYFRGKAGCFDGYFALLKNDEAEKLLKSLISENFDDVKIYSELTGDYGIKYTKDTSGDDLLKAGDYSVDIVVTGPNMNEEEYLNRVDEISQLFTDKGVSTNSTVTYFIKELDLDMSYSEFHEMLKENEDPKTLYKWLKSIVSE